MNATSLGDALEALSSMEKGRPYSLRPEDPKRRLADDLADIASELGITPLVIGGLAVNHHGYLLPHRRSRRAGVEGLGGSTAATPAL